MDNFTSHRENYIGMFDDARLDKRAFQISSMLYFGQSISIHGNTRKEAEQKAAYRFFSNEKVTEDKLIKAMKARSGYLCTDKDVLVLQDTTEINLENHRNRLQKGNGIGPTGNPKYLGFFLHGNLVLDADTETALGFCDIQLWHRPEEKEEEGKPKEKKNTTIPIEKKESNKWLKTCEQSKQHLSAAQSITLIEDREGDIYEQFALIPDERTHLIIRCKSNRSLSDGKKLFDHLVQQSVSGSYTIDLIKDIRKGIEKRTATVEVRYCSLIIKKPKNLQRTDVVKEMELSAVEVREINSSVKDPILWRILTTHKIESYEDAVGIVNKYRLRWYIEQLFRLLKKKGFAIESSELETGWAIRKLTAMALNAALRVMQLLLARDNEDSQPIEQVFDGGEIKCLQMINENLQGGTDKSKNNNNPAKLSWATWVIAKLGGWKGYNTKRPPGPIALKRGLDKFNLIYEGWKLALKT